MQYKTRRKTELNISQKQSTTYKLLSLQISNTNKVLYLLKSSPHHVSPGKAFYTQSTFEIHNQILFTCFCVVFTVGLSVLTRRGPTLDIQLDAQVTFSHSLESVFRELVVLSFHLIHLLFIAISVAELPYQKQHQKRRIRPTGEFQ